MVQYQGHVTKDGELLVNLEGNFVSLREFLQATRLNSQRSSRRGVGEGHRLRGRNIAVAK